MRNSGILVWLAALALAACGGGGNDSGSSFAAVSSSSSSSSANVASIVVLSSLASIPSDNSVPATITAYVRDANNLLLANVPVTVSATSGSLAPVLSGTSATAGVTDASGTVKYTLSTPGDSSNRVITITARAGTFSAQASVSVSTSAVTVLLLSDTTTIQSNNSTTAQLSAYVRDANNNFIPGVPVTMLSSSGALTPVVTTTGVAALTTDSNGLARATLSTPGDPTNRVVTVTARVGNTTSTANVSVAGSTLTLQGASSFILNQTQKFTVTLLDSGKQGISGKAITVTAPANGTVSATSLVTDSQGVASFNVTAAQGGSGTVAVQGLGLSAQQAITVNSDVVSFSTPAANAAIPLKTLQTFTAVWTKNGLPQAGQTVNFATTRGCVSPPGTTCSGVLSTGSAVTNAQGQATVQMLSDNAGGATVTATVTGGTVASTTVQFVSVNPSTIDVQASKFGIGPGEQSTITAVVRDAQNNLVANSTVVFNLSDVTGGTLTVPSAVTDSQGRAQTVYTAGTVASATNGVQITASVQGSPAVTPKSVLLTVAKSQLFISIGTGNTIEKVNNTQYKQDYVVQVTDANGAGVANVPLTMSIMSIQYNKGYRYVPNGATRWSTFVTATCADEDFNRNGILDVGEDANGSGKIEAGNIATVTPASVTTDANGFAFVSVYYPQAYALYLGVMLRAQAQVQGTASLASSVFAVDGLAADFSDLNVSPPGLLSPFGRSTLCTDTL